jgi:hypothetical protein
MGRSERREWMEIGLVVSPRITCPPCLQRDSRQAQSAAWRGSDHDSEQERAGHRGVAMRRVSDVAHRGAVENGDDGLIVGPARLSGALMESTADRKPPTAVPRSVGQRRVLLKVMKVASPSGGER